MRRICPGLIVGLFVLCLAHAASAVFHVAVIDEVLTSYGGDQNVQFIEIRMLFNFQTAVAHSVFAAFDSAGTYVGDILEVPDNVHNAGTDLRWIVGTAAFQTASGLTPDFTMPAGILPTAGGMVCYGGGGGIVPQNPPNWDRMDISTYVDCVAYGSYSGGSNPKIGTATALDGNGHSLQRTGNTHDNAADFTCGDPIMPQNNAGESASLAVTAPCEGAGGTPTVTGVAGTETPTPTATAVPTGTTAACVGDCGGDGMVSISDLVTGVNIALGSLPITACPAFDCQNNGMVPINCLVQGVNNALGGCPATPVPTGTTATRTPGGALGVRRFSINPSKSRFVAVLGPGAAFPTTGFQGFIELTAGVPNGGLAFVDVTDASDYISIDVPAGGTAVCLKVLRDQLPVRNAGLLSCSGGVPLGIQVSQDHDIGVVGACKGGDNAGESCSGEPDCPNGTCFNAEACVSAHGTVEGPDRPHPGVCNGPYVGVQDTETSPPGTLVIAPDPHGIVKGLPVELLQEQSTPCGDESATGMSLAIGFTTGHSASQILHFNDQPDATLSGEVSGVPFDCNAWTVEDGPGTLVLSATNLDTQIAPGTAADIIAQFVLVD